MGTYVNPENDGFAQILRGEYVDKTGLIGLVNDALGTPDNLIAVTRPRRFGKSYAAQMLVAYYSCGCDSRQLFEGLAISKVSSYEAHLNNSNVACLDMTEFMRSPGDSDTVAEIERVLLNELRAIQPDAGMRDAGHANELTSAFLDVVATTERKFIFVIDEWDGPLRASRSNRAKRSWIEFLRTLFKNASFTPYVVDAAYITGILPMKHYGSQSAVSNFNEYTMLKPFKYAPYTGFVESEVEGLAAKYGVDMGDLRLWYDGYDLGKTGHVYTPYSVMRACQNGEVGSYWPSSEAFESLRAFVDLDFDGLQQTILRLVGGSEEPVRIGKFSNDLHEVRSRDDVLTLLAHLGYLCYREPSPGLGMVHVPNEEVRAELRNAAEESTHPQVARIVRESEALLWATWDMDEEAVAEGLARAHDSACAPTFYNDEQALRAVVRVAYLACADHYAETQELPSGRGVADIAYVPRRGDSAPAMVVELKWNRSPDVAMAQIRGRDYPAVLRGLDAPVLLVGITYDPKTKVHACTIEQA